MSHPFSAGAVLYAKDIERVSCFYEKLLGLTPVQREPDFVVLEGGAFQLVVVAMAPAIAERTNIESPPLRRENTPVKLCFAVADLTAAREAAQALGGALNAAEREWDFQGHRVCDGHDPEGNVIQLRAALR